jgi:hypothetical protein
MKVLFLARHFSYLRNFESAIILLAERGHQIHLAAEREETLGGRDMVERIVARFPAVTMGMYPTRRESEDPVAVRHLRISLDYLRFLDVAYDATPHLRARAARRTPTRMVALARLPILRSSPGRRLLAAVLGVAERCAPVTLDIDAYLAEQDPDITLLTPLIDLGSPQLDLLVSSQAESRRTVLCVGSWDHLSSKARLRSRPDLVTVWNSIQKREAITMHGLPARRVVVTGAQGFDQWFGRQPSRPREAFCARVGLPTDRPFLLYVCSSLFRGTADEPIFVEKWARRIRESGDPVLRSAGILIRPHPARMDDWKNVDLSALGDVALWGAHPVDKTAKDDYFDSMHYAAAVVGLNTSAFLEAAVVGKSVYTILLPKYSKNNQEGTLHFRYLLEAGGGLLHVARRFEEHVAQLSARLAGPDGPDPKSEAFVEAFIRPLALDTPATPVFVDAIEAAAARPRPPAAGGGIAARLWRTAWPLIVAALDLRTTPPKPKTHLAKYVETADDTSPGMPSATRLRPSIIAPKVGKGRDPAKRLAGAHSKEALETRALVERLSAHDGPVIVGPWVSEAGFELLYWIPFLRWVCETGSLEPERLLVVSRGGSAPWYRPFASKYDDVFNYMTPAEFRAGNDARISDGGGRLKHTEVTAFDRDVIERVKARHGLSAPELLHPSAMYRLFHLYWMQHAPMTLLESFASFAKVPVSPDEAAVRAQLPARYVCAKFYANTALPDLPENRAFVTQLLERLTSSVDVVLLDTGIRFDDHEDYPRGAPGRVHTIGHLLTPENNLAVQTAIIRGAQAYVGTYGGFSYLAPLVGTDAVTFYSHPQGFRFDHLEVAKRVFAGLGAGSFAEVDVRRLGALQLAFGGDGARMVTG